MAAAKIDKGLTAESNSKPGRFWLGIALLLLFFAATTYTALNQAPRPNPLKSITSLESFYYPREQNAFLRLPLIKGNLNDIFISRDGRQLWAVGSRGLIIHSSDGGKNWQQQNFPNNQYNQQIQQINNQTRILPNDTKLNFSWFLQAHSAEQSEPKKISGEIKLIKEYSQNNIQSSKNTIPLRPLAEPKQELQNTQQKAIASPPQTDLSTIPANLNAVYFVDASNGYIAGDQGTVLITRDGGKNWQLINTEINNNLNALTLSRGQIWAVGQFGIVLNSNDSGQSWRVDTVENTKIDTLNDIYFSDDGQQAWIVGDQGRIFYSSNGGQRWQRQDSPLTQRLYAINFSASKQRGWIVGSRGEIASTNNGGQSWQVQNSGTQASLLDVVASDTGEQIWTTSSNGKVFYSQDGGQNWQQQNTGTIDRLFGLAVFNNGQATWVVGSSGTLLSSVDGGRQWRQKSRNLNLSLTSLSLSVNGRDAWTTGRNGTIMHSRNAGKSWQIQNTPTNTTLNAISFSNNNQQGWAAGSRGIILSTDDSGQNWQQQESGSNGQLIAIGFMNNGQQGWAIDSKSNLLNSRDGGKAWQDTESNTGLIDPQNLGETPKAWLEGDFANALRNKDIGQNLKFSFDELNQWIRSISLLSDGLSGWIVGSNGRIENTRDGGTSWSTQDSGVSATLLSASFPNNTQVGWITGNQGTILHTQNGGSSWQQQDSSSNEALNAIDFSTNGLRGIAVGDYGIIVTSNNGGESWQALQYQRTVAYWYWLVCLALLAFAFWLTTKNPQQQAAEEKTVADILASDKPLQPGEPDPLNFNSIALGLSRFMRNPATEPPLTVAITGPWGSGKSSMMNLLYYDLQSYGFTPVWFNAWHHQKGEQLLASLYANIKEQAIPSWFKFYKLMPVGLLFRLNLLAKRAKNHWLLSLMSILVSVLVIQYIRETGLSWSDLSPLTLIESFTGEANGSLENLLVLILGGPIAILIRALQAFGISPEKLMTGRNRQENNKLDPSARQTFAREFKQVSSCLDTGRMVIFIDDLDRCSKENVVDILEAMNFLSVSGDCYIVIGMDENWVKACIENHFHSMTNKQRTEAENSSNEKSFADHYLEKMVNIPVAIPNLNQNTMRDLLIPEAQQITISPFSRLYQTAQKYIQRYRVIFGLGLCVVAIAAISLIIPDQLFIREEPMPPPQTLAEWQGVNIDQFNIENGEPKLQLSLDENTTTKQEEEWKLVLEGNLSSLNRGITLAQFGEGEQKVKLVLKQQVIEKKAQTPNAENTSNIGTQNISNTTQTDIVAELLSGQRNSNYFKNSGFWLPLTSALLFLFSLLLYSLKIPSRFETDSDYFKDALAIWQPWISLQRNTPRAIKRYLNFVRYLAMRYKTPEPESSLLERAATNKQQISYKQVINEENIVGLSAIYAIKPEWLQSDESRSHLRKLCSGENKEEIDMNHFKNEMESTQLNGILEHNRRFGNSIFSEQTIKQFLEINAETKFN